MSLPCPSPVAARRIAVMIVDDEPMATRRLRELLASYPGFEVVATATSVAEARGRLDAGDVGSRPPHGTMPSEPVDVVFLDVDMPGGSGFDLLASVPRATIVVFVTAHPQYAIDAFGVGALDYLLKPIDPERLDHALERVGRMVALLRAEENAEDDEDDDLAVPTNADAQAPSRPRHVPPHATIVLPLASGRGEQRVPLDHICWIEALRNYSWLHLREPQRKLLMRRKLNAWQAELPADRFVRRGKSLLVNVSLVTQSEWVSRNETLLSFPGRSDRLSIGRHAASRLREVLGAHPPGGGPPSA